MYRILKGKVNKITFPAPLKYFQVIAKFKSRDINKKDAKYVFMNDTNNSLEALFTILFSDQFP